MNMLAGAVRDALNNVRSDGRVPRHIAARLRAAALEQRRGGAEPPAQEIVAALPPFEKLPEHARRSLYRTVLSDDSWSMWLRRASWRQVLARATRAAAMRVPTRYRRVRRLLDLSESVFVLWQARLAHELYKGALAWRGWRGREPTLGAALKIAGLDARVIASSYLRHTPQPLDTAAYWHDATRHTTVGVVVGIDFVVNEEGVWFVESNLNPGLFESRSHLYESDPFVTNLVRFAQQNGYSSIVFLSCNDYPADDVMASRLEQAALACGIRATVLEDRYTPQRQFSQTFLVPPLDVGRTLVVRSKMFHTGLDAIFHNKTLSLQALESYQRAFPDRDVRLPLTGAQAFPDALPMHGPLPNLVYKFPERDQGQGVVFLKVPSLARARAILADAMMMNRHSVANAWTKLRYRLRLEETGVFQAYVPSSLLDGRRLFIARAHVLATPIGVTFLSAHRVVSKLPVPESLGEGLVENSKPYIVNYSLDSEQVPMPPDEEARVAKAGVSVVRALCWAVEERFQTRPADTDADESRRVPQG